MNADIIPHSPTPFDMSVIDRADLQPSTRAKYKRELALMAAAGVDPRDYAALQAYADTLKSSRKQFLKSAIRLTVQGIEQHLKANVEPETLDQVQASLLRLEAMQNAVTVPQPKGQKAHVWLSRAQVIHIMSLCAGDSLEQKRDWIILGTLLGAGLRREELATLTFYALKQQPMKSGKMRDVLEVTGKGAKSRVIPISEKLGARLREWRDIVGGGYVARSLGRSGKLGSSMSAVAIFELCIKYGAKIGVELPAHSCRRTFAQLGFESGVPITQISVLLGHSSVSVTQRYLSLDLNIEQSASDFIPL